MKRILLAQTCDLPQFFYVAGLLRKQHSDWQIDLLVQEEPHIKFYMGQFGWPGFHLLPLSQEESSVYDVILFPLLSRGHARIKFRAWSIQAEKLQVDYLGNIGELRLSRLVSSVFQRPDDPVPGFEDFFDTFPHPFLGEKVLLVKTCHSLLIEDTSSRLKALLPAQVNTYEIQEESLWRNFMRLRRHKINGAVVYLSTEKGFFGQRLLPLVLGIEKILVIGENGDFSLKDPISFLQFLSRRSILETPFCYKYPRILFLQTEESGHTAECLRRLKNSTLFPKARIFLVCREADRARLELMEGIEGAVSWKRGNRIAQTLGIWRKIREFHPDINCAAFTGRPVFRKQKLAYFLVGSRRKLAFNAHHEAYWMVPATFSKVFKKDLFQPASDQISSVLLLESASTSNMLSALKTVQDPQVIRNPRITVFCRNDKAASFKATAETITYSKQSLLQDLRVIRSLFRIKPDVLVAVFAGSRIYLKHRILFWLLPAYNRLAFNQNLDCFYVSRSNIRLFFGDRSGAAGSLLRKGVRGILFLPRFLYLLGWWTIWRLGIVRKRS